MFPPYERLDAHCFELDAYYYLASGIGAAHLASLGRSSFSPVVLRYAYPRFETRRPFFPFMAADDWGNLYRGFDAVDWLISNGLMYPRADVAGLWLDGAQDQVFVKELDLAVPMTVYAAASGEMSEFPGQAVRAVVEVVSHVDFAIAPGANIPARLAAALPAFQIHTGVLGPKTFALLTAVLRDPRLVRFDEIDGLLSHDK